MDMQAELRALGRALFSARFWIIWIICQTLAGTLFFLQGALPWSPVIFFAVASGATALGLIAHLLALPPAGTIWARIRASLDRFWLGESGALNSRLVRRTAAGAVVLTALGVYTSGYVQHWESGGVIHHVAYVDPVGVLTVCDGHTGPDIRRGHYYTAAECQALRVQDLRTAERRLQAEVPNWRAMPQPIYAAFIDWTVNLGGRPQSTAVRYLRAGNWRAACLEIPRWVYAGGRIWPGLVKRRTTGDAKYPSERDLCLSGVAGK